MSAKKIEEQTCCAPCCCSSISFSCWTILASSSRASASGKPTSKADVVTTHTIFPTTFEARLTKEAVFKTRVEMLCRVVGGTMSLRAVMRSKRDSSTDASESREDREAELDVRDDEGDE